MDVPVRAVDNSASVVEDVPSHELYSAIVGSSSLSKRRNPDLSLLSSGSGPSVSDSEEEAERDSPVEISSSKGQFNQFYDQSLNSSESTSQLKLDSANRGFTLLSKLGWKESEGGLGRRRQGSLEPVKTVLKDDKKGLGTGKRKKPRITHYPANLKHIDNKKETKRERKRRIQAESNLENWKAKQARMMLRTDISEEYEALYMKLHS